MQLLCRYLADILKKVVHICKISANVMHLWCRYGQTHYRQSAVLSQICGRYLQIFYIYVSLVRVVINTYTTVYELSFLEIMFFTDEKSPYENVKPE